MPYADTLRFEGLLADACLRHRVGNPYAEIALNPDEQHRVRAYLHAVNLVRVHKVSESLEQHYPDAWGVWITKAKHGLERLEEAARSRHESAFAKALAEIDWDKRPAGDFIRAIDLALKVGAHLAARKLATDGAEFHFDCDELQKYARILAPPKMSNRQPSSNAKPKANLDWLKANRNEYRGKWVAIKDGTLLASGNSHEELITQVGKTKGRGILITNLY